MPSTSRMVPTCCDMISQSPCVTPAGLSIAMRTRRLLPPPFTSTSTSSIPSDCATRCATSSILDAKSSQMATMREDLASKIEEVAQRVAQSEGMELVEVEVKGGGNNRLVRIAIDKPAGVTHGDCEIMSQQVGTILDVEGIVPGGHYTLEVSSPGVERKLLKPLDYERFQGKK